MVIRLLLPIILWLTLTDLAAAQGDTRLMILHDHGNPVVSEMVELTIRGEYDLTVSLEEMIFPNSPDYDWVQIARDDWHKERVNGRLLQIFERKVAVFPSRDGPVEIGPVTHNLTYVTEDRKRAETEVTAPAITLNVHPFPGDHRPLSARQLTLTDELSAKPGQLKQNEVLTRRVTIEAEGTLAHYLPPRPDLRQPWMISFTAPEQRETIMTEQGPLARVVWEWQLRPHTGEPAILPGTGIPWFDTANRQIEIAPLAPIPFGLAGFGSNFGAVNENGAGNGIIAAGILLLCCACGLSLMLWRRVPLHRHVLLMRLRRHLPSPHSRIMHEAAKQNDLTTLRAAAERHLRWLGLPARGFSELDRQLYAALPPPGFDALDWLAGFRKMARSETRIKESDGNGPNQRPKL
ncbi:BatD family protein [Paracoccus saliphilus]|uniref:BatD family protein n=1 Tax=Paracoccus saliphilus TaxID=405559 RepID=A0AA45W747_9RHOB|nr:BatD family protein [Paracoccus saliphilus]WCR03899.1 BatD family protein [Paracoccus saliphilus]SIT06561.1 Oxygen tolerance [Paracoccus saliphilus]